MPLFHGNAVMALWAPALAVGACVALEGRFSASRFVDDVRRHRAARFTYVGKAIAYVLATPERPDDAGITLRIGFGTEASGATASSSSAASAAGWWRATARARAGWRSTARPTRPPAPWVGRMTTSPCSSSTATAAGTAASSTLTAG